MRLLGSAKDVVLELQERRGLSHFGYNSVIKATQ